LLRTSPHCAATPTGSGDTPVAKVEIKGLAELERKLKALPEVVELAARAAVKAEVGESADDLRRLSPVKDGDLRRSIQEEIQNRGLAGVAAVTARHAEFVIHGTSDTPANDFVTPVINMVRRRFEDRFADEARAQLGKL
jgi:HK97 gp10 family phage protein